MNGVIPYFMAGAVAGLVPVLPESSTVRSFWLQVNPDPRQVARFGATINFIVERIEASRERFLSCPPDSRVSPESRARRAGQAA